MARSPKANVFIHLDLSEQVEVAVQTQAAKFVLNEIQKEHHRHQLETVSGWASLRIVNHVILAIVICSGSKTREATVVSAHDDGGETKPKIYNGFTLHLAEKMEQKALAWVCRALESISAAVPHMKATKTIRWCIQEKLQRRLGREFGMKHAALGWLWTRKVWRLDSTWLCFRFCSLKFDAWTLNFEQRVRSFLSKWGLAFGTGFGSLPIFLFSQWAKPDSKSPPL